MGLAERLATRPATRGHHCTAGLLIVELASTGGGDDLDAVIAAMQDPKWTSSELSRQLEFEGYTVSERHLRVHRSGRCNTGICPDPHTGTLAVRAEL